jgi:hypothetical protein
MTPRAFSRAAIAVALASGFSVAEAQVRAPHSNEGRVDARYSRNTAVEAGWSYIVPMGLYARGSLTGAIGKATVPAGAPATGGVTAEAGWQSSMRLEVVSRFLLDPFRQSPFGLSIGGGAGMSNSEGQGHVDALGTLHRQWRPYLVAIVDLELTQRPGWTPTLQVGVGGGFRVGLLLRRSADRWR